ncbi:protein SEMI-ROLLED LEAF 2-like [Telopea speciosissima]|uniref:protein SEMI-ROLLED LEAF 2-like n=1 Tax=Telopea speciosissima TaxID=54955 RepID=UPI001CC705C0|nr:protein SEMI-ROLLED LEAF 2-like [Telopea speciosissima]XP_043721357.1 protein SEMI-ROLLED LEAF 2-like [Telopea speciosissima]
MGFISRRILPVCGNMCVCCPAFRSRSRQPVKRYKKLLAEIFPKSLEGAPNERKIGKLCEYAAKNPFRIPKIAKYLEQRCSKELRSDHIKYISVIIEAYHKLLCMCKEQMAYFSLSLLNVVVELLDYTKQDSVRILGCKTLTRFIRSQADGTYAHNIEKLVHKVCLLARESGEECTKCCLRASSLQCLSAMVWFMAEFSHVLDNFDEIVHVTLDNYEPDINLVDDDQRGEPHHNWVDEVVRCEARGGAGVGSDLILSYIRPRREKKDCTLLTREEIENPKIWAQICVQKMAELAKESTTMRWVLDPMFIYFDKGKHWVPQQGLAMVVLSDMCYFVETAGNEQLVLSAVIRHLDHKNVAHDLRLKSDIIQIATALARQLRTRAIVSEIGIFSDLCRHLRKSLQATVELVGQQESDLNISLQTSIEDCLLEIAKGIDDARPLLDLMAITLEKLPPAGVVARATIWSLFILAHVISVASVASYPKLVFPEALLLQLLKTMMHPDIEARVGAHQIFAVILVPSFNNHRHDLAFLQSGSLYEPRKWHSKTASPFASAAALLEKLRKEKDSVMVEMHGNHNQNDCKDTESGEEEWKQGWARKNSANFYKMMSCSIIERSTGPACLAEAEPKIIKLSEDQTAQLLSGFWIQANLTDNLPSNFEAIAHSFSLTLIASHFKSTNHNLLVRFFQLPISLRNISLDPSNGLLLPSCQRSLFTLASGMLMFAAKIYNVPDLNDLLKSVVCDHVDPFLGIGDDFQLYIKPQTDVKEYGSAADHQAASSLLSKLREAVHESEKVILDILVGSLSRATELDAEDVGRQLSLAFTPDDAILFGPQSLLDWNHLQTIALSNESLSFDGDFQANSLVEDDVISESSVADASRFIPKVPMSPSLSLVISVGQLLESALEVAGQVAGTSVSTSPIPYSMMASQCEALGTGSRMKLSSWLARETHDSRPVDQLSLDFAANGISAIHKISNDDEQILSVLPTEPWSVLRLPPASPFDNFLKAAGCQGK